MSHFDTFFKGFFYPQFWYCSCAVRLRWPRFRTRRRTKHGQPGNLVHKKAAMNHSRHGSPCTSASSRPKSGATALLMIAFVMLFAQAGGQAATGDALPYSKGFLVTGNYVVGGVDLTSQANPADADGYSTGTIPISGVPAGGVNIVAAYLYFEVIHPYPVTSAADPTVGIKFRGTPISPGAIRAITKPLSSGGATCWGSAGQGSFAVSMFRANVLSLLPKQYDSQNKWTGKYIVNSAELPVNAQHTVTLREKTGDSAIQSAGATLFLVYRVLTPTEPLRKIVAYDGLYTAYDIGVTSSTAEMDTMSQHIRGFYKSAGPSARITHVVGTGGNNQTEKITVTSSTQTINIGPPPVSADPFPQTSPGSDRSWGNPTYDLGTTGPAFMPGTTNPADRYGETVTTTVSATNTTPAACRAWAAVFFSTEVADVDDDGLPDGLEDAPGGLKDPNDAELPNLNAMGAKSRNPDNSLHPDLFVEYNAMYAEPGTTYGSVDAPYPNTTAACYDPATKSCTDAVGHHHFPTPEDFKRIGDRFKAQNITFHVDVGSVLTYHGLGVVPHTDWVDDYTSTAADEYLVGSGIPATNVATLARGGEVVRETACSPSDPDCIFPDYPGSVGWKAGLLAIRNAPVNNNGGELNPDLSDPSDPSFDWLTGIQHRLRFDRERRPYFHYGLGAHTRGTPVILPCLANGEPTGYTQGTSCTPNQPNPDYQVPQVPSGSGGLGDLPGRNFLATHGLWDEFVGRPYARAVTIFHEIGHNVNLWHSGVSANWGNATQPTVIDPNCKPNFLSSMNYLFELYGVFDQFGNIQLDYSHGALPVLQENGLFDGASLTTPPYRRAWYAPFYKLDVNGQPVLDQNNQPIISPLVLNLGLTTPALRFCGAKFGPGQPITQMVRVVSETFDAQNGWYIDWDADGVVDNPSPAQDVNFDGHTDVNGSYSDAFTGYNDWANIRLDQISANGLTGGSDDFVFMVGSDDLVSLVGSDDFPNLIGTDELTQLIGTDELLMLIGSDDFPNLIGTDDFVSLVGTDDFFSLIGTDEMPQLIGSDDLASLIGSDQHAELTYKGAQQLGPAAPYQVSACIVGTTGCHEDVAPFTLLFHRDAVSWQASTVGHVAYYEVQRKRADIQNGSWVDVGQSTTNSIIDTAVLPKLLFLYRVRAHFDDPVSTSAWAYLMTPFEARNDLPDPRADSYVVAKNATNSVTVPAPGVLGVSCTSGNNCTPGIGADRSSDNPTTYVAQRAVVFTGPVIKGTTTPIGTLTLNPDGGFTLTYPSSFTGSITFQYKANDGFWPVDPTVPMNGKDGQNLALFAGPVTVTIEVKKK
jgi:hypothetical protein